MLPAAESGDGGVHCTLRSCWEPQDSHTGTGGSHHLQAQPQPRAQGCVQSKGEPGETRWVPSIAFSEVFPQKLKLYCKNKPLLGSGLLLGAVSQLRQLSGRSRTLGTAASSRTSVSHRAPRGHPRPSLLLLPDPVCAWPRHPGEQRWQVTSSGLSRGAGTANAKWHHNYRAPAAAPASAPELLHQPCTQPAPQRGLGQRLNPNSGTCSGFFRAPNLSGSFKPGISWAAQAEGRLLYTCRFYFWAIPVLFSLDTRCFLKERGLPCTLSSLKCSSRSLRSSWPGSAVPGERLVPAPMVLL